ncbi:MAG: trimethylamine methyltransferase family protein [Actinobacteria bacterium]|nr:trimethylamine methyltransferase family protein [Actinomycetota bacterium]
MAYADKCYVGKRVKLELLSPEDVRQIHEATLDVIENVGVKFHSQNALDILEANGASVDRETTVAKIPAVVVEKAMSTVPHELTLGARNPEYDLPLDGEHVYISSDGCGVFYRDPATGEVRSSRKEDLENCAKVVQALDNVSATSAVVSAQDCPIETRVLHEFDACVRSSEKHTIVVSIKEDWEARSLIRMAEALAGGAEELRRRPMFTAIICTVSPLHQERFGMDLALVLAKAGIPVSFYPMPILGATGPVTIAGSAVVNNAEFVSGATLVQLAHPGAKVIHGGGPTAMDMSSGAYASNSPEALLLRGCQGHMADFYGVPAWYGAGATTAKEPGIQSAYENTLAMFMAYANGADVTFGTGLLDGSRILCLENMVVDDEIIGMVKRILSGIEVSEETLAVELIKKMGFNGNYLFDNHTRKHVRELWQAKLGETGSYDAWKNAGAKSTTEKAQEKVAEILAAPAVPFPADLGAELDAIIAAAAREAAAR